MQNPIESKNVKLRRLKPSDFDNMRLLESDPLVTKFIPARVPQTEEQTRTRLDDQIAKQKAREPFGIWVAELKSDFSFIGWFCLMPVENKKTDEELELGYMIIQKYWNKGFTTEICKALSQYAKGKTKGLMAKVSLENHSSTRVLEKVGFTFTEVKAFPDRITGELKDLRVFHLQL